MVKSCLVVISRCCEQWRTNLCSHLNTVLPYGYVCRRSNVHLMDDFIVHNWVVLNLFNNRVIVACEDVFRLKLSTLICSVFSPLLFVTRCLTLNISIMANDKHWFAMTNVRYIKIGPELPTYKQTKSLRLNVRFCLDTLYIACTFIHIMLTWY